jgi:hypothetical protein
MGVADPAGYCLGIDCKGRKVRLAKKKKKGKKGGKKRKEKKTGWLHQNERVP